MAWEPEHGTSAPSPPSWHCFSRREPIQHFRQIARHRTACNFVLVMSAELRSDSGGDDLPVINIAQPDIPDHPQAPPHARAVSFVSTTKDSFQCYCPWRA